MKKIFVLAAMLTLVAFVLAFAANDRIASSKGFSASVTKVAPVKKTPLIRGDEDFSGMPYAPTNPGLITASPGDTLGYTQYDYQTNGSSGNRIVLDSHGGLHVCWMNGVVYPSERKIYFNYVDPTGAIGWPGIGTEVNSLLGMGYTQIDIDNTDLASVGYHHGSRESLFVSTDAFTGGGSFTTYGTKYLFAGDGNGCIWPYMTIDNGGRLHVTACEASPTAGAVQTLGYARTTNGGQTWTTPVVVDTVITISPIVTSSRVSNKVAIVYSHPFDTTSQLWNDVYYIMSTDGVNWDFAGGKVNITDYQANPDSHCAYTDVDAVFDFNDNLHIIWNSQATFDSAGLIYLSYDAKMNHYDVNSGTITQMACAFDSLWAETGCDFGAWNFSLAKSSIGVDNVNNALFATYTSWTTLDCSAGGFANGDIFMQYSTDGGATWTLRGNVTESHTPDCLAGDCDSDHWSSLAEVVDDDLHLFYVNDKDAGGIPQTEGSVTDNPMLYYAYSNPVRDLAIPPVPYNIFPYDNSADSFSFYQFEWSKPVGATGFRIDIDNDASFNPPILITEEGTFCNSQYINTDSLVGGTYYWRVRANGHYGTSPYSPTFNFEVTAPAAGCDYVPGDINGNGSANGIDVTYGVGYFKGGPAPRDSCDCAPIPFPFYAAGDVNGNCAFNGIDVTFFVSYLKGGQPALLFCSGCPPARRD